MANGKSAVLSGTVAYLRKTGTHNTAQNIKARYRYAEIIRSEKKRFVIELLDRKRQNGPK